MIKTNFEYLITQKASKENRKIPASYNRSGNTGLSLTTIERVKKGITERVYISTLNTLCRYFSVGSISELIEYTPD